MPMSVGGIILNEHTLQTLQQRLRKYKEGKCQSLGCGPSISSAHLPARVFIFVVPRIAGIHGI